MSANLRSLIESGSPPTRQVIGQTNLWPPADLVSAFENSIKYRVQFIMYPILCKHPIATSILEINIFYKKDKPKKSLYLAPAPSIHETF
jgi:hypothetical protein